MNWAEVSLFLGILLLYAWVSWLAVKAMGHGYEQKDPFAGLPKHRHEVPPMWDSRIRCGEKSTPKESGEFPQPGDK